MTTKLKNKLRKFVVLKISNLPISDQAYYALRFWLATRRTLNRKNPTTLSDKVDWLRSHYDYRQFSPLVDKLAVRDFVTDRIGQKYLVKLYKSYDSAEEIDFSILPNKFYLTANNGSNMNYFCFDKSTLDEDKLRALCKSWLQSDYSKVAREYNYCGISPRVLSMELLVDSTGKIPADYKFFCFNGHPKCIQVDVDRFTEHRRAFFTCDWDPLKIQINYPPILGPIKKPEQLQTMLSIVEKLCAGFPFVRVDLYEINGSVLFGELTFTPNGNLPHMSYEDDKMMGSWLDISDLQKEVMIP